MLTAPLGAPENHLCLGWKELEISSIIALNIVVVMTWFMVIFDFAFVIFYYDYGLTDFHRKV